MGGKKSIRLHKDHCLNPSIPVCFFCGKQKNEIILFGAAMKEKAPMSGCYDKTPCEECQKMMEKGVMLISVKAGTDKNNPYRTGRVFVVKVEVAKKMFDSLGDSRVAFVEDEALDKLGFPKNPKEGE